MSRSVRTTKRIGWRRVDGRLAAAAVPPWARFWITLRASVTKQLEQFAAAPVRVVVARDDIGPLHGDERRAVRAHRPRARVREVVLETRGEPMVVARSVWEPSAHGGGAELNSLRNRPLGELLFSGGLPRWRWREFARIAPGHPLWSDLSGALLKYAQERTSVIALRELERCEFWARRTLYIRNGAPLLVMEAFLSSGLARAPSSSDAVGSRTNLNCRRARPGFMGFVARRRTALASRSFLLRATCDGVSL